VREEGKGTYSKSSEGGFLMEEDKRKKGRTRISSRSFDATDEARSKEKRRIGLHYTVPCNACSYLERSLTKMMMRAKSARRVEVQRTRERKRRLTPHGLDSFVQADRMDSVSCESKLSSGHGFYGAERAGRRRRRGRKKERRRR